jgi:hypothetical protein
MDEIRLYARDLTAEARRVPSVLMVAVGLLLLALSTSSEMVADVRAALVSEMQDVWDAASPGAGGRDVKKMLWALGDAPSDDFEGQ